MNLDILGFVIIYYIVLFYFFKWTLSYAWNEQLDISNNNYKLYSILILLLFSILTMQLHHLVLLPKIIFILLVNLLLLGKRRMRVNKMNQLLNLISQIFMHHYYFNIILFITLLHEILILSILMEHVYHILKIISLLLFLLM